MLMNMFPSHTIMTNMLESLNLSPLAQRREELRLTFLFKISERLVPDINKDAYLVPPRTVRKIKDKKFEGLEATNYVTKYHRTILTCDSAHYKGTIQATIFPENNS